MKRLERSLSKECKCPKLYLENLEKIFEILEEAKAERISIHADGYSYDSLEELIEKQNSVKDFKLETHQPYITLIFSRDDARLYIGSDDLKSRGIFSRISDILIKRERKLLWVTIRYNIIANILIFSSLIFISIYDKNNPNYIIRNISLLFLGLGIIWTSISSLVQWRFYSIINLLRRDKISNFFIRNKDNIIISIVSTVIGAAIGIFLGIVIQRFLLP